MGITLGDLGNGEILAGIDLDTRLDDDGAAADWAKPYLRIANSYTEISPSGSGLKTLFRIRIADLALARRTFGLSHGENGRKKTHDVETATRPLPKFTSVGAISPSRDILARDTR